MKAGSLEFIEMQKSFEKLISESSFIPSLDISKAGKDEKAPIGYFYNNGFTNQLFHAFMHGYQCGRINYLN